MLCRMPHSTNLVFWPFGRGYEPRLDQKALGLREAVAGEGNRRDKLQISDTVLKVRRQKCFDIHDISRGLEHHRRQFSGKFLSLHDSTPAYFQCYDFLKQPCTHSVALGGARRCRYLNQFLDNFTTDKAWQRRGSRSRAFRSHGGNTMLTGSVNARYHSIKLVNGTNHVGELGSLHRGAKTSSVLGTNGRFRWIEVRILLRAHHGVNNPHRFDLSCERG